MKSSTHFPIRAVAATAVFVLSMATAAATTTNVIFSFAEDEGEYADTDLETDSAGNIYGTTVLGGDFGSGTVFKLSPSPTGWEHTVLYSFTSGADGGEPYKGVTLDREGNLYGTAVTGGSGSCGGGCGVVYKLTNSGGTWTQTVIHAFTGGEDGSGPGARVTYGSGVVFELAPRGVGEWNFRTIYSFRSQPDGSFPYGALLFDRLGNIYGTTYYGGANGIGAVYQLSPRPVGEWNESVLYSFQEGTDGNSPIGNLVSDSVGNLYGTTSEGGLGSGTIFKLSPIGSSQWVETVVHPFEGPPDGAFAYNGMVVDGFGNFYGATVHGGDNDDGAIYQFTP